GEGVVLQASSEMNRLDESVKETAQRISGLGQRSDEISGIVKVIRDIADQTNLLALNAAIEAARAGEQGRGFAVVADEVRKLAERTSNATIEIGEMILSIQNETKTAVSSMESGASQVQAGVDLALQAGDALKKINEGSQRMVGMVHDIAAAIKEQSTASDEIANHVCRISQMAEENSGYVDKMLVESKELDKIAESLKKSISQFVGGTANEAKLFVEKAIQYYHANGRNKAFAAYNDPAGEFIQRDMYIFVYSLDGRVLAHGGNGSLIGKDMRDARDANGVLFIQNRIQLAQTKGAGWQDYQFLNPDSGQVEQKTSFIQKVDDFVIGCGVYK
ncbi:MAG: cache domain-containing protein, partial [Pseudomonadota bacterium]|nr:cache domain-containing protein [Pseudomonadota bacterium]